MMLFLALLSTLVAQDAKYFRSRKFAEAHEHEERIRLEREAGQFVVRGIPHPHLSKAGPKHERFSPSSFPSL